MKDTPLTPRLTEDGSYTFFSEEFQETFHSSFGAKQEAEVRYIKPCAIEQLATERSVIRILDVCYGLGYNSAAALSAIWSINPRCKVELFGLEISSEVPREAIRQNLLAQWHPAVVTNLAELSSKSKVCHDLFLAQLLLGDARKTTIEVIAQSWQADAIFLDPFSPPKCPQLWTVEFLNMLVRCLSLSGRLATYSSSAAVRTALISTELNIGSIVGAGRKSPGTLGSFECKKLPELSVMEREHLKTRAAIPYRDPTLAGLPEEIIQNRQQEQKNSNLEPTSQWRKRWLKYKK